MVDFRKKADEAAVEFFINDLKGIDDDDLKQEIDEVQDRIDEAEQWAEALAAEVRIRARK